MKLVNLEQNTPEWHEYRRTHIGASDIPPIMEVSKWHTPYSLWRLKLGFISNPDTQAMFYGREMEPLIRKQLNEELKRDFQPVVIEHDELSWASASLDGWDGVSQAIAEIKAANNDDHEKAKMGQVPRHYFPQVQWQMFVADAKSMFYVSYHQGDMKVVLVERDDEYIKTCVERAAEFVQYLENLEEPPLSENDHLPLDDPEYLQLAAQYCDIRHHADELSKKEKDLRLQLLEFTDDGNCEGGGVRFTRVRRNGAIDYKKMVDAIIEAEPDLRTKFDPDDYRKDDIGYFRVSLY